MHQKVAVLETFVKNSQRTLGVHDIKWMRNNIDGVSCGKILMDG